MKKRMICAIAALVLALGSPARAMAAQSGSIRIWLGKAGEVTSGGSVTLYRVGEAVGVGYRLSEAFGGGMVTWEDTLSMSLAAWLAERTDFVGIQLQLDADGYADFTDLSDGLYLLLQEQAVPGHEPMEPILVELPYEGLWNIQVNPRKLPLETPSTGDTALPVLACWGMGLSGFGIALLVRRRNLTEGSVLS